MNRHSTATLALALALSTSLLTACGAAGSIKDGTASLTNGVVEFAKEGVGIRERSGAREIILDLNSDTTSVPMIMSMIEPVIADSAAAGAFIEVWVVTSGVAAAMTPVDLEAAHGGDLLPIGNNAAAWEREAEENTDAILAATRIALTESRRDDTGADLFGAVAIGATRATELPGVGSPEVILISTGIHRTNSLDLQTVEFTVTDPAVVASRVEPIEAPDVAITIIGAGRFPNVSPPPDAVWAAGIRATWVAFCSAAATDSCTVRDRVTRKEG